MKKNDTNKNKGDGAAGFLKWLIAIFVLAGIAYWLFLEIIVEYDPRFVPEYGKEVLSEIIHIGADGQIAEGLDGESPYGLLLRQTGLGAASVDALLAQTPDAFIEELEKAQQDFFRPIDYVCRKITAITGEEKNIDEEGRQISGFQILQMKTGDVFLSFSTHSLGWRHGHSALILNGETGRTLEAVVLGKDSEAQGAEKWRKYPTFVQLRLSEEALEIIGLSREGAENKLASIGKEKLTGIPYGLLTGIPIKYEEMIQKTQCAHLVWYAFKELGLDIDGDGGWLVTPKDIWESPYFEIVQIYGMDPRAHKEKREGE